MAQLSGEALARFESKFDKKDGCWIWEGGRWNNGYPRFKLLGKWIPAHRVSYEIYVSEISEGLQLDHLCRVKHCVNPAHLEPVTQQVNMQRAYAVRTTCPQGHRHDALNSKGHRICRQCAVEHNRRFRMKAVA